MLSYVIGFGMLATILFIFVDSCRIALENQAKKHARVTEVDELWEVLVPASNKNKDFSYEHHMEWDDYVKSLSGGLTVMKTATGKWVSPEGVLYKDRIIPVKIKCTYAKMLEIVKFTIKHYEQEAVMAYKISDEIILLHKDQA